MSIELGKFACESCGRSFQWKPELAGKRAKCKCGAVVQVPTEEPGAEIEPAEDWGALEAASAAEASAPPAPAMAPAMSRAPTAPSQQPEGEKKKWSDQWWFYIGGGVVLVILAFFEHGRLVEFESDEGASSIRVGKLEYMLYNMFGATGVLVGLLIMAAFVTAFGVYQFVSERKAKQAV